MLKEFNCFLIRHTSESWFVLVWMVNSGHARKQLSLLLLLLLLLVQVFSQWVVPNFSNVLLVAVEALCLVSCLGEGGGGGACCRRWGGDPGGGDGFELWVSRRLVGSCSPCGWQSLLTSLFKGGAWCRFGLRSGLVHLLLVGLVGGFLIDWSRHRMRDFQYFPLLTSFPVYHGSLILVNSHFSDCNCIPYFL